MEYRIPKRTIEELDSIRDKHSNSEADVYNHDQSGEGQLIHNENQESQNKKQKLDSDGIALYSPNIGEHDTVQSDITVNTAHNLLETKKPSIEEQAQLIDYRQKIKAQVNIISN